MGMDVYGNNPKIEKGMDEFPIYAKYEDMPWGDREKDPKWKEVKENLLIQLKESVELIRIHTTRASKIEGAIDINDQIFEENK